MNSVKEEREGETRVEGAGRGRAGNKLESYDDRGPSVPPPLPDVISALGARPGPAGPALCGGGGSRGGRGGGSRYRRNRWCSRDAAP